MVGISRAARRWNPDPPDLTPYSPVFTEATLKQSKSSRGAQAYADAPRGVTNQQATKLSGLERAIGNTVHSQKPFAMIVGDNHSTPRPPLKSPPSACNPPPPRWGGGELSLAPKSTGNIEALMAPKTISLWVVLKLLQF